jgi:hypothetical protein
MKKRASDQYSHDRRYQERKRAEATKQPGKKKAAAGGTAAPVSHAKEAAKQ